MTSRMKNNQLEGMFASPKNHPITCANPAPWKIIEFRIEVNPLKVWIRGDGSMWFRADQCHIGTKDDLEEWLELTKTGETVHVSTSHTERLVQ